MAVEENVTVGELAVSISHDLDKTFFTTGLTASALLWAISGAILLSFANLVGLVCLAVALASLIAAQRYSQDLFALFRKNIVLALLVGALIGALAWFAKDQSGQLRYPTGVALTVLAASSGIRPAVLAALLAGIGFSLPSGSVQHFDWPNIFQVLIPVIGIGMILYVAERFALGLAAVTRRASALLDSVNRPPERAAVKSPLTPRQLEVTLLLAEGLKHVQIAERLVMSVGQTRAQLKSARERTGCANDLQLVDWAWRSGLIA